MDTYDMLATGISLLLGARCLGWPSYGGRVDSYRERTHPLSLFHFPSFHVFDCTFQV